MTKRTTALVKGELLEWARDTAGFPLEEAAQRLGVETEVLSLWEGPNETAPTIPQLRKLASLYRRPLAVFYLDKPPKGFQVLRDLRRLPGTGLRVVPPALTLEIRRANERRHLALEMLDALSQKPSHFRLRASIGDDPEDVGLRIRDALKVSMKDQTDWRDSDGRAALNAWRDRIERFGVLVFQTMTFESEIASGFAIAETQLPLIAINRKDAPRRRTFSLLHELSHICIRMSSISDLHTDDTLPPEDQEIEVFCNHVAAAAMMPRRWFGRHSIVHERSSPAEDWTDEEIAELSKIFGASREAVVRRLLTLGKTTERFYRRKRQQYNDEYYARREAQKELSTDKIIKRNMPQETISNLGRPLVRWVLANYHREILSLSDVTGYLGLKAKHIPKLEQMSSK